MKMKLSRPSASGSFCQRGSVRERHGVPALAGFSHRIRLKPGLHTNRLLTFALLWLLCAPLAPAADETKVLTGKAAMADWTGDAPGVRRRLTVDDLPEPNPKESVNNPPKLVKRPAAAWPKVPEGFSVREFASDLKNPRVIVTALNGDFFVAESKADRVRVMRDADNDGKPELSEVFVDGLKQPFGIAFYPPGAEPRFIYVANTDSVMRWSYRNGQTKAEGKSEKLIELQ